MYITHDGEAPQHIILGDAWNAAAPTGASWRNWPRGHGDWLQIRSGLELAMPGIAIRTY